jgi:hypothetical protein
MNLRTWNVTLRVESSSISSLAFSRLMYHLVSSFAVSLKALSPGIPHGNTLINACAKSLGTMKINGLGRQPRSSLGPRMQIVLALTYRLALPFLLSAAHITLLFLSLLFV